MGINASIVLFNPDREELARLMECLTAERPDRIYVVDNSPEPLPEDIRDLFPRQAVYIHGHGNVGYGAGHNIALRMSMQTGARYHCIINPDICWNGTIFDKLRSRMERNPDIGHIMPLILYPDGSIQHLCKLLPTPADLFTKRFFPAALAGHRMRRFQLKFTGYDREMDIPFLSGCFMFLRIEALKEVGIFDERFFLYSEDIDLTRRIHALYRTVFYPEVTVTHRHVAGSASNSRLLIIHILSLSRYFNKWGWFFDKERRTINCKTLERIQASKLHAGTD